MWLAKLHAALLPVAPLVVKALLAGGLFGGALSGVALALLPPDGLRLFASFCKQLLLSAPHL